MFTELGYFGFILMGAGIFLILIAFIPVNRPVSTMVYSQSHEPVYRRPSITKTVIPEIQKNKGRPLWKKFLFVVIVAVMSAYAIRWWRKKNGK